MKVPGQTFETGVSATDGRGRIVSTGQEVADDRQRLKQNHDA